VSDGLADGEPRLDGRGDPCWHFIEHDLVIGAKPARTIDASKTYVPAGSEMPGSANGALKVR